MRKYLNIGLIMGLIVASLAIMGAYFLGRHEEKKITFLSELSTKARLIPIGAGPGMIPPSPNEKGYLLNFEVVCMNGRDIGRLSIDLNLATGKWVVVRNDSKLMPNCDK